MRSKPYSLLFRKMRFTVSIDSERNFATAPNGGASASGLLNAFGAGVSVAMNSGDYAASLAEYGRNVPLT